MWGLCKNFLMPSSERVLYIGLLDKKFVGGDERVKFWNFILVQRTSR